jgi:hypothetical protein
VAWIRIARPITYSMMSSIRSVLIKSCMTNIQREINQLEHWLNHLPDQGTTEVNHPTPTPVHDAAHLSNLMNRLSEQISIQQYTLSHISDRLSILESMRQVHIDEPTEKTDDPWIDNLLVPLSNEIVGDDCVSETMYTFSKETGESTSDDNFNEKEILTSVESPSTVPVPVPEHKVTVPEPTQEEVLEEKEEEVVEEEVVEEVEEEEVVEEEVVEEEVVEEVEEEEVVEEEVVEEEVVEEEVVEEEVEEEEELEEITYLSKKYYKNQEGFIYGIEDDEQPSENPIGYWKEKTKSIAFYKTK